MMTVNPFERPLALAVGLLLGPVSLLLAPAVSAVNAQDAGFPAPRVEIALAELREMAPLVDVPGTVISLNDSALAAEVEGALVWRAQVGDTVKAGDVVARIDNRLLAIARRQALAEVKRIEADLKRRAQDVIRTQDLVARNNSSQARLDEVIALRDMLREQLNTARANLDRAEGDLARASLRAPFAGHVVERLANVGEYVSVGENVVRLVDTQNIEVSLPAPIQITPYLRAGDMVSVTVGSEAFQLPIRTVVPVGDAVSRMVEVRLDAGPDQFVIGAAVRVSLPSATPKRTVAIPRDALVLRGGSSFFFRVSEAGTVQQFEANLDDIVGLWVSVPADVKAGDQIVVRGGERLTAGDKVEIASRPNPDR